MFDVISFGGFEPEFFYDREFAERFFQSLTLSQAAFKSRCFSHPPTFG